MKYLLDVNALIALGFSRHEFHNRVARWVASQSSPILATCAITELGFVRVLSQAANYAITITQAQALLLRMKKSGAVPFVFLPDDHDISHLPAWVKTPRQTTDGHLLQLAKAHGAILATLDEKIPYAYKIP